MRVTFAIVVGFALTFVGAWIHSGLSGVLSAAVGLGIGIAMVLALTWALVQDERHERTR